MGSSTDCPISLRLDGKTLLFGDSELIERLKALGFSELENTTNAMVALSELDDYEALLVAPNAPDLLAFLDSLPDGHPELYLLESTLLGLSFQGAEGFPDFQRLQLDAPKPSAAPAPVVEEDPAANHSGPTDGGAMFLLEDLSQPAPDVAFIADESEEEKPFLLSPTGSSMPVLMKATASVAPSDIAASKVIETAVKIENTAAPAAKAAAKLSHAERSVEEFLAMSPLPPGSVEEVSPFPTAHFESEEFLSEAKKTRLRSMFPAEMSSLPPEAFLLGTTPAPAPPVQMAQGHEDQEPSRSLSEWLATPAPSDVMALDSSPLPPQYSTEAEFGGDSKEWSASLRLRFSSWRERWEEVRSRSSIGSAFHRTRQRLTHLAKTETTSSDSEMGAESKGLGKSIQRSIGPIVLTLLSGASIYALADSVGAFGNSKTVSSSTSALNSQTTEAKQEVEGASSDGTAELDPAQLATKLLEHEELLIRALPPQERDKARKAAERAAKSAKSGESSADGKASNHDEEEGPDSALGSFDLPLPVGIKLPQDLGLIELETTGAPRIYLDGEFMGRGPVKLLMAKSGKHQLLLSSGGREVELPLEVLPGRRARLATTSPAKR